MKLLCLDTSSRRFSLAVSDGEKILRYANIRLRRVLDSSMMPAIERILKNAGVALCELDGLAVGLGPGSFTSLRVGLATVKGLAFAAAKPVVGIASLDILAAGVPFADEGGRICVICDARRGLLYNGVYQKRSGILERESDYALLPIDGILSQIKGDVLFVGDGVQLVRNEIQAAKHIRARFAPEKFCYPQARFLAPPALKRFQKRQTDDAAQLTPIYLYPEDCQVDKKRVRSKPPGVRRKSKNGNAASHSSLNLGRD